LVREKKSCLAVTDKEAKLKNELELKSQSWAAQRSVISPAERTRVIRVFCGVSALWTTIFAASFLIFVGDILL